MNPAAVIAGGVMAGMAGMLLLSRKVRLYRFVEEDFMLVTLDKGYNRGAGPRLYVCDGLVLDPAKATRTIPLVETGSSRVFTEGALTLYLSTAERWWLVREEPEAAVQERLERARLAAKVAAKKDKADVDEGEERTPPAVPVETWVMYGAAALTPRRLHSFQSAGGPELSPEDFVRGLLVQYGRWEEYRGLFGTSPEAVAE